MAHDICAQSVSPRRTLLGSNHFPWRSPWSPPLCGRREAPNIRNGPWSPGISPSHAIITCRLQYLLEVVAMLVVPILFTKGENKTQIRVVQYYKDANASPNHASVTPQCRATSTHLLTESVAGQCHGLKGWNAVLCLALIFVLILQAQVKVLNVLIIF